jgi:hypothetical protein
VAAVLYALATLPRRTLRAFRRRRWWGLRAARLLLVIDIGGIGLADARRAAGFRAGAVDDGVAGDRRLHGGKPPRAAARRAPVAGLAGRVAVGVAALFPGEVKPIFGAGAAALRAGRVSSYGLFGAAVLHALMLDAAERRLRRGRAGAAAGGRQAFGMPLLQLERLTFRFVQAGFVVLTATLVLGVLNTVHWRWGDHKTVFSLLAWAVFAALLAGRQLRGWRGRRATRWLYAGAVLLLLAYVGSRFVLEVLLGRGGEP